VPKEDLTNGFGFTTGAVRFHDLIYFVGTRRDLVKQGIPHSRFFSVDRGQWGAANLDWLACSMTVARDVDRLLVLGNRGQILRVGGGDYEIEAPIGGTSDESPARRGELREIRAVAGESVYAVGIGRQVYQRVGTDRWTCIDQAIRPQGDEVMTTNFESIDGFGRDELYAVGWEGEIWWYDGQSWRSVDSPTNLALYKVRCGGDGFVYACGQAGTILRGRRDSWEALQHDAHKHDFWGLAWFNDRLYLSSTTFVYELVDGEPSRVDYGDDPLLSCYHLDAADGILLSTGAEDLATFDGTTWKSVD